MRNAKYFVGVGGLLILIASIMLAMPVAKADTDVVSVVSVGVPESCTMTGIVDQAHEKTITNGTYESEIGTTTLKVFCNDNGGFAVYAVGYTDDEVGKNVLTSSVGSSFDIATGTATSGNTSNWAMKLSAVSGTYAPTIENGFGSYKEVPESYTKVASRSNITDVGTGATGSNITTTYAAYISSVQPAGSYAGQVKYTLVHPVTDVPLQPQTTEAGCVSYYPSGGNVEGTMGCYSISDSDTSTMLLASNYSREGYGFAGWSDAYDYATNSEAHFYGPHDDITFTAGQYSGTNDGLSLYAVWVKSAGSFQDSAKVAQLCGTGTGSLTQAPVDGTANLSSVSALTDERDGETYAIAKLADGNCWMIENLRLEAEDTRGTTNVALAQGYATSTSFGDFTGLADAESAGFSNSTLANSRYSTDGSNGTVNIGSGSSPGYRFPRYNNLNTPASAGNRPTNPTSNVFADDGTTVGMYGYGNYYTWSAAIANTIYYSSSTATDESGKTSENVNTSICPSGWKLPYGRDSGNGNTSGGFHYLNYKMNNNSDVTDYTANKKLRGFPVNILLSGGYSINEDLERGSTGYYWSSTAFNKSSAYSLALDNSSVYPGVYNVTKSLGFSIRCIASGS